MFGSGLDERRFRPGSYPVRATCPYASKLRNDIRFVLMCPSGTTNTNVKTTDGLLRPWFESTPGLDPLGFGAGNLA